jgi:exodeoxyribonuclease V gamma subunit
MLRAVRSNRTEALLGALAAALPAPDPFAPATIVVGGHLVARWLTRELARARGIACGIDMLTFDRFVERTWGGDDVVALDRRQLTAVIASALADERVVRELPAVAGYLGGSRDAAPRRVQLAEHVAELVWQYALTRPDWMPAFVAGRAPKELADDDTARWQASLVAAALSRLPRGKMYAPVPMLPFLRRGAAPATPVFVFGMSFLARAQLEALAQLGQRADVTVFWLDPCEPLWDDVRRVDAAAEPLPLALWGRAARDTLGALVERTGGDVDGAFVRGEPATVVAQLMTDVLDRRLPEVRGPRPEAPGVAVLACPNSRREIEVVAAEARARLDADPTLRAHEIAVWIAGDAERYLAQAPSAFEAVAVPCHLIDAPIDDRGRIGEAVLALLELPGSAMARSDLLRVLTHPAVLARHPHVDADDWIRWTQALGIVHGADDNAHIGTYLESHPGHFHWDQGVRRLALGAFMTRDVGAVAIHDARLVPEEIAADQQASAATFALLVRSLCADAAWLASHEAPLAEWATIFAELVDAYLDRGERKRGSSGPGDDAARDVERVRSALAGIAHVDLDGRRVGFREAREHAMRRLEAARSDRGEPLAAGVMVAPLAAMRAVPFRVAFVVGLDERGGFSANDRPSALDIRSEQRAGDVSPRDRDRHSFLEVLLGARERLYLSYVAAEAKGGAPLAPSSVVLELCDALAPYLGAPSSRDTLAQLTRRAPLHRFGAGGDLPPTVTRERWAVRARDAIRAHLRSRGHAVPDEDGMLALLGHDSLGELRAALAIVEPPPGAAATARTRPLSLANLRSFLEWPVQAWAQAVLGLDELPDDTVVDHDDEPFHVDRPTRAQLLREVLAAQLRGGDPAATYDTVVRDLELRGQFPVGVFGEAARENDLRTLKRWRDALGPLAVDATTRLAFGRSHSPNAELLPALDLALSGGRTVRLVGQTELLVRSGAQRTSVIALVGEGGPRSPYHLRGAIDHAVLAAAELATAGHSHILVDRNGKTWRVEHEPWTPRDARAFLATLVEELLDQSHGYLLPFDQLVRAHLGDKLVKKTGAPTEGLGYGPITRHDGLDIPAEAAAFAQRRLAPLADRMRGEHGFGGDK